MIAQDLAIDMFPQIGGQPNTVSTYQRSPKVKITFFLNAFYE